MTEITVENQNKTQNNEFPAFAWMCSGIFFWPISEGIWGEQLERDLWT